MRNKVKKIKNIFIERMIYSAVIQALVFGFLIILIIKYIHHNQLNTIIDNLLINDQYTLDQVGSFQLLDNKYALDLELHNIGDMRKLDSIQFVHNIDYKKQLRDCNIINYGNFKLCKKQNGIYFGITSISFQNVFLGYILTSKKYHFLVPAPIKYTLLIILITVLGTLFFNFIFLFLTIKNRMENNTKSLLSFISAENYNSAPLSIINIEEYKTIAQKFIAEKKEIINLQKDKAYFEVKKIIAEQVAHDIRSPLATINTIVRDMFSIEEEKRIILKSASQRINDIANNLLIKSKDKCTEFSLPSRNELAPELIFVILENIIAEKKYEYHKLEIDIKLNIASCSYCCFANINLVLFKRVLSNLINNSVEAVGSKGSIILSLISEKDTINIIISDNGCGIPVEILSKVTQPGFSYNKESGAGLGLAHAKQYIDYLSGKFLIESTTVSIGTKITISLPKSDIPAWFCTTLNIRPQTVVVVLDDDHFIHDAWETRLKHIRLIKIVHFFNTANLTSEKIDNLNADLYLVDHELLYDDKNGLDFIESCNLSVKAVLVTSGFEDIFIRGRCRRLNIKIIPKPYVPYIPIMTPKIENFNNKKIVFIDDDDMMRKTWVFAAEVAGLDIITFSCPQDFTIQMKNYFCDTVFYIDSDLGNNMLGEDYAKELFNQGFTEIYLSTGHSPDCFKNLPWIKSIVGKEPPFLS